MNEFDPEQEEKLREKLEKEMIRPSRTFKGEELWPCTKGVRMLYEQATIPNDTILFCCLAFVYLITKRGGATFKDDARKHLCGIVWDNPSAFRAEILEFRDSLTNEETQDAIKLADEELSLGLFSAVQAESTPGKKKPGQKKTRYGRPIKLGNASRSPKQ